MVVAAKDVCAATVLQAHLTHYPKQQQQQQIVHDKSWPVRDGAPELKRYYNNYRPAVAT